VAQQEEGRRRVIELLTINYRLYYKDSVETTASALDREPKNRETTAQPWDKEQAVDLPPHSGFCF
jgi:hypothetical protein